MVAGQRCRDGALSEALSCRHRSLNAGSRRTHRAAFRLSLKNTRVESQSFAWSLVTRR